MIPEPEVSCTYEYNLRRHPLISIDRLTRDTPCEILVIEVSVTACTDGSGDYGPMGEWITSVRAYGYLLTKAGKRAERSGTSMRSLPQAATEPFVVDAVGRTARLLG